MELVNLFFNIFDNEDARIWGTRIFVGAVVFDFILSYDKVPENSIREWILTIAQKGWLMLSGSVVPYALGVLMGHFYHPPGVERILPLGGYWNLGVVVIIGVIFSIANRFMGFLKSKDVLYIAIFGLIIGSVIWPV